MCHLQVAGSDRRPVVGLKALRFEALRFVIVLLMDLGALFAFLMIRVVVCVTGPSV